MYLRRALTEIAAEGSGTGSSFGCPGPRRKNEGNFFVLTTRKEKKLKIIFVQSYFTCRIRSNVNPDTEFKKFFSSSSKD